MSLKEKILFDLKAAMKEGDAFKRDTLRLLDSAVKNIEIEKKKREEGLNDDEVVEVLSRAMKQRQDSILQFEKGGRPDLAEKERKEVEIISCYLPKQLSAEEAQKKILEVIEKSGANSVADFGKVMGQVMAELKGKFDGNLAKEIVKQELEKKQK